MEEKKQGLERLDLVLIIISFILLTVSSGWLVLDYSGQFRQDAGDARPVGKITNIRNVVKRKFDKSLVWYGAINEEIVYENDWVFTGTDSTVKVELDDGGSISIDPNSIVVLAFADGKLNLNLTSGSFLADLKGDANITVTKNGKSQTFKAGKSKLKVLDKAGESKVAVLEGSAVVDGQEIQANEQANFDGEEVVKQDDFVLINTPKENSTFFADNDGLINFEWDPSQAADEYTVEVDTDQTFGNPLSKSTQGSNALMKIPFTGQAYWRLKAKVNGKEVIHGPFAFNIRRPQAPIHKLPMPEQKIKIEASEGQDAQVSFEWNDRQKAWGHYNLQIAKDFDFVELVQAHNELITESYITDFSKSGLYFWRVQGIDKETGKSSEWSQSDYFELNIRRPQLQPPVALTKDNIRHTLTTPELGSVDENGLVPISQSLNDLKISWNNELDTSNYEVLIARDLDFQEVIDTLQPEGNEVSLKKTYLGPVFFQVTPIFENEDAAPPAFGEITTYLPSPTTNAISAVGDEFTLEWNPVGVNFDTSYELEIRKDDANAEPEKVILKDTEYKFEKGKVQYMNFRVRLVDAQTEEPLSEFSKASEWIPALAPVAEKKLASVSPVLAPEPDLTERPKFSKPPKRKSYLLTGTSSTFVVFRWNYHNPVDYYELEIARRPDMSQVVITKKLSKRRWVLKKSLPAGVYYYRVRGLEGDIPHEWSETNSFRMIQN